MKKIIFLSSCLLLLCIIFTACSDNPAKPPPPKGKNEFEVRLHQLNENIHKVKSPLPSSSLSDLSPLDKIADSRYIGMGEATHGTREFQMMKFKIFKYLVKKHGFRVFAIEAQMGESYYIDKYIRGGNISLDEAMNKMHF